MGLGAVSDHDDPCTFFYPFLNCLNGCVCRVMYGVTPLSPSPLPRRGPALLVSNHSSLGDPLVLLATAGRSLHFLMAREIYDRRMMNWAFRAFRTIPVSRGARDVRAVRSMLKMLERGEVVALFPEGGIDQFRDESGHMGVAYLAVKTGAPVIPVTVSWERQRPSSIVGTLFVPGRVMVRYGEPLRFPQNVNPKRDELDSITKQVMSRIKELGAFRAENESDQNKSI